MALDERAASEHLTKVKTLLFDLDGTLVVNRQVRLNISFVFKMMRRMKKYGRLRVLHALKAVKKELEKPTSDETNFERSAGALARKAKIPLEDARSLLGQAVSDIFPKLHRHFYPTPGAREFIDWAREDFKFILATNPVWREDIVRLRLKWAELDQALFPSITHSERMHRCKPFQEYYEEILEQENLKAEECMLIGDTPKMDLPATRARIPVYLIDLTQKSPRYLGPREKRAPAWVGDYPGLKKLLESVRGLPS